jgi:hypothetical protein
MLGVGVGLGLGVGVGVGETIDGLTGGDLPPIVVRHLKLELLK